MEWSVHSRSEYWKRFHSAFLSMVSWANGTNLGTKWSSRIKKNKNIPRKHPSCIMIILCQRGIKEQVQKMVRLLLCTAEYS